MRMARVVHSDAVQVAGRMKVSIAELGVDLLSVSAHKLGGAPGAGALIMADADLRPAPLLAGGGQERGLRAGSQNVPSIAAFGAAAEQAAACAGSRRRAHRRLARAA